MITTPILYDFYNYDSEDKEFIQLFIKFTQVRAVLLLLERNSYGMLKLELYACIVAIYQILYSLQNLALFGALLFFVGMKNSIPRRQPKKKAAPKTKTY